MAIKPIVSFLLVHYRTPELTKACIESIEKHTGSVPYEIIVVDNSCDGKTKALQDASPGAIVAALDENRGFGAGCNAAANLATGKYLYLLNTDTLLHEDSASILAQFLDQHPKAVAVGCTLTSPDGTMQPAARYFLTITRLFLGGSKIAARLFKNMPNVAKHFTLYPPPESLHSPVWVDWCVGASLMVRSDTWQTIKGFDEDFFMYAEEMDLCLRLSESTDHGEIWFTPTTAIMHLDGGSNENAADGKRLARIAAGHRLYFKKHFSGTKAAIYTWGWYFALTTKTAIWWCLAKTSGQSHFQKKYEWCKLFVQEYFTLQYPLPRKPKHPQS